MIRRAERGRLRIALAAATCLLACAAHDAPIARAFDRSEDFSAAAEAGGGGGRRFTGAPADGLTCTVCHRAGRSRPTLTITGMPDSFVPGSRYDLVLDWPGAADNAALVLEVATADGRGAGTLALPDDSALEARDRCAAGAAAAHVVSDVGDRQVVTLDSCGASRLRVSWIAPSAPGAVWIDAVLVQGDSSGDPSGDSSVEHSRLVPAEGFGTDVAVLGGGCRAAPGAPTGAQPAAWLVLASGVALARRRRPSQGR